MLDSLFTAESLLSLQGAAAASLMVPNVLGYLIGEKFNKYRKYVSLFVSFGLAFMVAVIAKVEWLGFVVALFNGFLIFASAVGINQMGSKKEAPSVQPSILMKGRTLGKKQKRKKEKEFFKNWF